MIKRVSLVWKRDDIDFDGFRSLWLGKHAEQAGRLSGALEYVIDFNPAAKNGEPDGIATLRFESVEALDAAFSDKSLVAELMASRNEFAARVAVFLVDEFQVFRREGSAFEQD